MDSAAAPPFETCPNCSTSLLGSHCHECGQKKIEANEYSLKRFIGNAINDFTDLESSKVFRTLSAMILRPGLLAVEYLGGRRGKYLGPLKLYLTFSALYFLFAWSVLADVRGGSAQRIASMPPTISMAKRRGLDLNTFADKLHEKTEKYASGLRVFSVLISGTFLAALYFRQKKYYVEHLVFSLYYYSFDFFCKSFFALLYLLCGAIGGFKLPVMVLNLFYPLAFVYLMFALRRVYQQKWVLTVVKAVVLFACETLLFVAVNIGGLAMAYLFA
ncbi:MAG TPA: DUF3667 domain-containing protein [Pyrinomonadaceae bacterium]|nr:DUF3667 domain-containing protein [Pyrinomonadaceae bacterium]